MGKLAPREFRPLDERMASVRGARGRLWAGCGCACACALVLGALVLGALGLGSGGCWVLGVGVGFLQPWAGPGLRKMPVLLLQSRAGAAAGGNSRNTSTVDEGRLTERARTLLRGHSRRRRPKEHAPARAFAGSRRRGRRRGAVSVCRTVLRVESEGI